MNVKISYLVGLRVGLRALTYHDVVRLVGEIWITITVFFMILFWYDLGKFSVVNSSWYSKIDFS